MHIPQNVSTDTPHDRPVHLGLPVHAHWRAAAGTKGFEITGRVDDRYHLMLKCAACGTEHRSKLYVLMNSQPRCPGCMEARWREEATAAGLVWLGRDQENRHYGVYQAPCGHRLLRQFELVKRIASGECAHRCDLCHHRKEEAEAEARGWTLLATSRDGARGYRSYRHGCGHVQWIARGNMQTGRFNCEGCGEGWSTAPSHIYCMRFELPQGAPMIKLGFSRDPESRLHHQLLRDAEVCGTILRAVNVETGRKAQRTEKRLHGLLQRRYPEEIIPPEQYQGLLRVRSEIYSSALEPLILGMLDEIAAAQPRD